MVILYVDDDAEDIEIFCEAVKVIDPSIKCLVAQNGKHALDILHADLLPDFIFLDINMPVINGRSLLSEIRKEVRFKSIPVVMYSTTLNLIEVEDYKKLGANHFLVKPNHFQDLVDGLSAILDAK